MKERNNSYSYTKTHTAPMQPMPYSTRFYEKEVASMAT